MGRLPSTGLTPTFPWRHRDSPCSFLCVPHLHRALSPGGRLPLSPLLRKDPWVHVPPESDSEGHSASADGPCLKVQALAQPISSWDAKLLPDSWHGELRRADSLCFPSSSKHRQGCSAGRCKACRASSARGGTRGESGSHHPVPSLAIYPHAKGCKTDLMSKGSI